MKPTVAATLIIVGLATPALSHRLDEYLQATTFSIEKHRVEAQIRLTPGVAVLPLVMAGIDTDADGVISEPERRAYAKRVLSDLYLSVDGVNVKLHLLSIRFPEPDAIAEGLGEIQITFFADLPRESSHRKLTFENHHQRSIGTYLVNSLVPQDAGIRIKAQSRNYEQSLYELEYQQGPTRIDAGEWLAASVGFLLLVRLALLWRSSYRVTPGNIGGQSPPTESPTPI